MAHIPIGYPVCFQLEIPSPTPLFPLPRLSNIEFPGLGWLGVRGTAAPSPIPHFDLPLTGAKFYLESNPCCRWAARGGDRG